MHSVAWLVVIPELEQRMKKHMSLEAAMASIKIEECPNGYRVFTPAGWAEYDMWGYRTVVSGIPEFLPKFIRLRKDEKPVKDDLSDRISDNLDGIITNAIANNGEKYGWKISRAIQEDKQTREGKAATHSAQARISVETPESADEKLTAKIRQVIRQEQQKGGMLWRW
jgi:hypothetical protein